MVSSSLHEVQEVVAGLPLDDSLDYSTVKPTTLKAYELVPEVYQHKI